MISYSEQAIISLILNEYQQQTLTILVLLLNPEKVITGNYLIN